MQAGDQFIALAHVRTSDKVETQEVPARPFRLLVLASRMLITDWRD